MDDRQTGRKSDQFNLRMPDGMRDLIAGEARKSGRSMNAEIVHRLAVSLKSPSLMDMGFGLDEELEFEIINAAAANDRSVKDEISHRLRFSLDPQTYAAELENKGWNAERRYRELLKLHMHLTPEERRLLEERDEIAQLAKVHKISSKTIGQFVKLNPIGNRGRVTLVAPKSDYSPIWPDRSKDPAGS